MRYFAIKTVCLSLFLIHFSFSQTQRPPENSDGTTTWLILQAVPSFAWTTFPSQTNFAFEWELTPLLYSFGMTKLVSPWHSFIVVPPARFTGSIEFNVSGQVYTTAPGSSHFAYSAQLLGQIPLMERGEYLGAHVGVAAYSINNEWVKFGVAGFSTLFGILHYTLKYSPEKQYWMNSLEFRLF